MATGENQEGPLDVTSQDRHKAQTDVYADHRKLDTRPNPIANALGKITLAGAAIVAGVGGIRGTTQKPAQTIEDAQTVGRFVKDASLDFKNSVIPNNPDGEKQQVIDTTSSSERQGSVGNESLSTEKNDLTRLSEVTDAFIDDLLKVPTARMHGLNEQNMEGVKVTVHNKETGQDEDIIFTWTKGEKDKRIKVMYKSEKLEQIYDLAKENNLVTLATRNPRSESPNPDNFSDSSDEIIPALTDRIQQSHQQWNEQRLKTSSTQNIPAPTNTPTLEPIPTNTPIPYNPRPNPFNRGIQEAGIQPPTEEQQAA